MKTLPDHQTCHHVAYRMGCEEYELLLARAAGRCEICGETPEPDARGRVLSVDHDHRLGMGFNYVRGMTCHGCNSRLGQVDRGKRTATPAEQHYLDNAWHLANPPMAASRA